MPLISAQGSSLVPATSSLGSFSRCRRDAPRPPRPRGGEVARRPNDSCRGRPARRRRRSLQPGPRESPGRPGAQRSQVDRLVADATMPRTEAAGGDHVDMHPEQGFQILGEPNLVEKRCFRVEVDEQIDIARRSGLASGNRTEHAYPRRMAPTGNRQDRVASRRRRRASIVGTTSTMSKAYKDGRGPGRTNRHRPRTRRRPSSEGTSTGRAVREPFRPMDKLST